MPYTREDEDFPCPVTFCTHNGEGECQIDEPVDDLLPSESCFHYHSHLNAVGNDKTFKNLSQLHMFIEDYAGDIPFMVIEEDKLRVVLKRVPCPEKKGHMHQTFFQVSKETEDELNFLPGVDDGIFYTHKIQIGLEI